MELDFVEAEREWTQTLSCMVRCSLFYYYFCSVKRFQNCWKAALVLEATDFLSITYTCNLYVKETTVNKLIHEWKLRSPCVVHRTVYKEKTLTTHVFTCQRILAPIFYLSFLFTVKNCQSFHSCKFFEVR
jgi:hypothetical protein